MADSSSQAVAGERRPKTSDDEEKMVVNMEYSQLPEVVPVSSAQPRRFHAGTTPLISPLTPQQPDSLLHPGDRRPKPALPWSPASFPNPHLNNAPPPYDPSAPPSPSPSHLSHHFPLSSLYPADHHQRPSFSSSSPFLPPASTHPLPPSGYPTPTPAYGPGPGLGPIAATRQRRRTCLIRWICVCIALLAVAAAVVLGVLVGIVHYKFKHDNEPLPAVTTPVVVGRWSYGADSGFTGWDGRGEGIAAKGP